VSEYGKVLGLVTMDDLLAQIFGVIRDERAELQSQPPGARHRMRTPVGGSPSGEGPAQRPSSDVDRDTGPIPRSDLDTGPVIRPTPDPTSDDGIVSKRAETDLSGAIGSPPPSAPGDSDGVLDPPPPSTSGIRPVHAIDEVTPPAVDIQDLHSELHRRSKP
jgi:hypothetical protein